ncbi:hypothetical protein EDD16DRAFT_791222 [Pisolithus croceorrhizus]|nr:hypothetical protein EDD16DRAFT_791222 [Pisolithus croceorrhizus]
MYTTRDYTRRLCWVPVQASHDRRYSGICDDISNHQLLALHLRLGGDPRLRNSYFINIQTDGPATSDLWQHRLYFKRSDGGWVDIFIPYDDSPVSVS